MRIILATPIYPPEIGGPATYAKELSARLNSQHEITVVAYTEIREPFPGTKLFNIEKSRPLYIRLIKYFWTLWKLAPSNDLIYAQNAMAAGLPAALVSMFKGKPLIIRMVGDEAWERAEQNRLTSKTWEEFLEKPEGGLRIRLMMLVQRFVLNRANFILPPSEYNKNLIIKAYGIDKSKVIVNYTATEEPEIIPIKPTPVLHQVCTVARLISLKKIDEIIKSLALVRKRYPDAKLVIAGEGPERESLERLAIELGLDSHVIFLGKISRAETWQLRKNSSVYVINSTHESLPISVLTSLAAGIPTIATNVSGIREVIYDEKTGLLVEPGDVSGLAKAIERLFEDSQLREKIIENGHKILKEKFSWEAHLENLDRIFKSVLSKPSNKL